MRSARCRRRDRTVRYRARGVEVSLDGRGLITSSLYRLVKLEKTVFVSEALFFSLRRVGQVFRST